MISTRLTLFQITVITGSVCIIYILVHSFLTVVILVLFSVGYIIILTANY